jgi:hypothetical protein
MRKIRPAWPAVLGTGMLLGLLGVPGCSEPSGEPSGSKKESESRRDAIQKPSQSGIPGKAGGAPNKSR